MAKLPKEIDSTIYVAVCEELDQHRRWLEASYGYRNDLTFKLQEMANHLAEKNALLEDQSKTINYMREMIQSMRLLLDARAPT